MSSLFLFDILKELVDDENSFILWNDKEYKRIHKKYTKNESELVFIPNKDSYGIVTSFHIGNSKLNINVKVEIKGQVFNTKSKLKMDAKIYKDYCLVRNSFLNVEKLKIITNDSLFKKYELNKLVKNISTYDGKRIITLDLRDLNIINPIIVSNINTDNIVTNVYKLEELKIYQYVLKNYMKGIVLKQNLKNEDLFKLRRYIYSNTYLDINNIKESYEGNTIEEPTKEEIEFRNKFKINELGIFKESNRKEFSYIVKEMYVATIIEWKIERFPRIQKQKSILKEVESLISKHNDSKENLLILNKKLKDIKELKKEIEENINLIRLYVTMNNKIIFNWEEYLKKEKRIFDNELNLNMVLNNVVTISRLFINNLIFRQDEYLLIIKK